MVVWTKVIVGSKDTENFSDSGYSLKLEPINFAAGLDIG